MTNCASHLSSRNMPSIFDAYAAKICRHAELPPGEYDAHTLNSIIMTLPLGEAHAALDGVELEKLPRLGETVSLNDHMQRNFFDVIGMAGRELYEFTVPVLVARRYLERLEGWRDWRTLAIYLGHSCLEPSLVFRNTPFHTWISNAERDVYYSGDLRVLCHDERKFVWG